MHHRLNTCVKLRGTANLFTYYTEIIDKINYLILNDPEKLGDLWDCRNGMLCKDSKCQSLLGTGSIRATHSCFHCTNLSRVTDFQLKPLDTPFYLNHGVYEGTQVEIKKYPIKTPYIIVKPNKVRGDPFSLYFLTSIYLSNHFINQKLPHFPMVYTEFICGKNGYYLQDHYQPIKNCTKLLVIDDLLKQILVIFTELQEVNFFNGKLTYDNIAISSEKVSYGYSSHRIKSNFTVKLINTFGSSITVGDYNFGPDDNTFFNNTYDRPFRCTAGRYSPIGITRHNKFVGTGYDFYMIILSLVKLPQIKSQISDSKIWKLMWNSDDLPMITDDLIHDQLEICKCKFKLNIISELWLNI